MGITHTRTMVTLEITPRAYAEVAAKLRAAEYDQAFLEDDGAEMIDMHGIALKAGPGREPTPNELPSIPPVAPLEGNGRGVVEVTEQLGQLLNTLLGQTDKGFALVMFEAGENGQIAYTSNAARSDVAALMGALSAKLFSMEAQAEQPTRENGTPG